VAQQLLAARLIDGFTLSVVPVLLGGGTRLLDNLGADLELQQADVVPAPGVTHLKYRVAR
jgi:dihydrofolate reductase